MNPLILILVGFSMGTSVTRRVFESKRAPRLACRDNGTSDVISCHQIQSLGKQPVPSPDTPTDFLLSPLISGPALSASTPPGYDINFRNLHASSSDSGGYLGTVALDSYNVTACATPCSSQEGCLAFNIFFERDPAFEITLECTNPNSTTIIKCAKWANEVSAYKADNNGFTNRDFEVKIGGSNGYTNQTSFMNQSLGDSIVANARADGSFVSTHVYSAPFTLLAIALVFAGFL